MMARQTRGRMRVEETQLEDVDEEVEMHVNIAQVREFFFRGSLSSQ